jgi:hypothetical protein
MRQIYFFGIGILILTGLGFYYLNTNSDVTPSHVFAKTETILKTLDNYRIVSNNHSELELEGIQVSQALTDRQPRHVMQKTREILLRIDRLKTGFNLKGVSYPIFPVRKVTPSNVFQLMELVETEVNNLGKHYLVQTEGTPDEFDRGKEPSDVYLNLVKISHRLDILGAEPLTPSDVWQMTATLVADLKMICAKLRKNCDFGEPKFMGGKTPSDVYGQLQRVHQVLRGITLKLNAPIIGGIVEIKRPTTEIAPADVLNFLNNVLADVGAVKESMSINAPSVIATRPENQTPSHVFQQMKLANLVATAIFSE